MPVLVAVVLAASPLIIETPFVQQRPDFCGEAVGAMALQRLGLDVSQEDVFDASGLDPALGRGVWANELKRGLSAYGLDVGQTWYRIEPSKAQQQLETQWQAMLTDLRAGIPSIVCMHYDASPKTTEHFRLITGYDAEQDEVIFQEPAVANGEKHRLSRSDFISLWTFRPAHDRWVVIRLRMAPTKKLSAPSLAAMGPRPAEVSQYVQSRKLPKGMTAVWEPPFLVVGDESPETVKRRAKDIVRWCRDLLLKDFFTEVPSQLHEVWVLRDAASYEHISRSEFNTTPSTPYGYYLASKRALIMNIKPGYGTLTHELVHPFFEHAWPNHPAWLNEGLASLFEFPFEDGGHLKGRVNWRLPALQNGLRAKVVPSLSALAKLSDAAFYADDSGVYYAQARYVCFWLQERGLLVRFVRRAIELQHEDPTGLRALEEVLGAEPDSVRSEWEHFVLGLSQHKRAT